MMITSFTCTKAIHEVPNGDTLQYPCQTLQIAGNSSCRLFLYPPFHVSASEIDNPRVIVDIDQYILGLRIAPDKAGLVQALDSGFDLPRPFTSQGERRVWSSSTRQGPISAIE